MNPLEDLKRMHEFVDMLGLEEWRAKFLKEHPFMLPKNWEELLEKHKAKE